MLLPTPPLPLETAIIRLIRAKRSVIMLVLGQSLSFNSFYVLKPDSTSAGDFKVRTATFRTLNVSMRDFRNKMNCLCRGFIELFRVIIAKCTADPAFERGFSLKIRNLALLKMPSLICFSAKRRIGGSTC